MEPIDYLRILRRRWTVVAAVTLVAVVLAWLSAPGPRPEPAGQGATPTTFEVTHTLVPAGNGPFGAAGATNRQAAGNLEVLALYLRSGEVPKRTAEALSYPGQPADLVARTTTKVDAKAGTLSISATDPDGERAAALVNTFGAQLVAYLGEVQADEYQRTLDDALARSELLRAQLQGLEDRLARQAPPGDSVLRSQRDAISRQYSSAFERYQQLNAQGAPAAPLVTAQSASPIPVSGPDRTTVPVPSGRGGRSAAAALLGLLVGMGAAVGIDRLDTRPRTKEQFESALDLPVVAEIPALKRRERAGLVTRNHPASAAAEAYRVLRAALPLVGRHVGGRFDPDRPAPQVYLVTSASPSDGKTTVVGDLAASFAEAGRSVLVLDCDFWHPRLHSLLGCSQAPGVLDVMGNGTGAPPPLVAVVQATAVPGLSLVAAGGRPELASELLRQGHDLVERARQLADVVIIDTGPLLSSSSATELLPVADAVAIVSRAGRTSRAAAQRTVEVLARLEAPTLGVVVVGVERPFRDNKYYDRSRTPRLPVSPPPAQADRPVQPPDRRPLVPLPAVPGPGAIGHGGLRTDRGDQNGMPSVPGDETERHRRPPRAAGWAGDARP